MPQAAVTEATGNEVAEAVATGEVAADNGAGQEPRERRSRDRYGRDRGNRGPRGENGQRNAIDGAEAAAVAPEASAAPEAVAVTVAPEAAAPVARRGKCTCTSTCSACRSTCCSSARRGSGCGPPAACPKWQATACRPLPWWKWPSSSGLQWVNSDADKIAAVQAAIAAEPKPVHVPRERPAPVELDDRPLVLVETRRDLRDMKLPFENDQTA